MCSVCVLLCTDICRRCSFLGLIIINVVFLWYILRLKQTGSNALAIFIHFYLSVSTGFKSRLIIHAVGSSENVKHGEKNMKNSKILPSLSWRSRSVQRNNPHLTTLLEIKSFFCNVSRGGRKPFCFDNGGCTVFSANFAVRGIPPNEAGLFVSR